MKKIATLISVTLVVLSQSFAQTTYTINSNKSYSAACSNCTFNIASGATLTLNDDGTCSNCTFNGGNIVLHASVTCQPCTFSNNNITMPNQSIKPNSNTTSFDHVTLTVTGNGFISANTPVSISNSVFTFSGNSFFNNNGGQLDISASTLNFFGSSYFNANAGPVNLKNASRLVAGDGLSGSAAYIKMNGPVLNLYDAASSIVLSNTNNYYYNWSAFNSLSNNKTYATTYPNAASKLNCGAAGQNACGMWSSPTVFGPSAFNSNGVAAMSALLPVTLVNFSINATDSRVALNWSTAQEINAAYFFVERSANGSTWETIGTVAAKGNASTVTSYTYTDGMALSTTGYYRLALVDLDGKKAYSDIKVIHASLVKGISFYPNPAIDVVNVSLAGSAAEVNIRLLNQAGQVLQERKAGSNTALVSLNVQQYPRGMYILKITAADGTEQTGKLMIAR